MSDPSPAELDAKICAHMARREKLKEMLAWLERRIDYRTRRIRELSVQRTESLNFKLPLDYDLPRPEPAATHYER